MHIYFEFVGGTSWVSQTLGKPPRKRKLKFKVFRTILFGWLDMYTTKRKLLLLLPFRHMHSVPTPFWRSAARTPGTSDYGKKADGGETILFLSPRQVFYSVIPYSFD
eukprot:scaffold34656_cov178-Amphora_coffeaeformis.AAC.7